MIASHRHVSASRTRTSGHAIPDALCELGVDTIFALQGGAALPIFDALGDDSRIRLVWTAHEQGAAFAADGYARVAGRPGVCVVTSGPGALNTLTAVASAFLDSVPLIVLTGQVPRHLLGTDAFQEAETLFMSIPVTKQCEQVTEASRVRAAVISAYEAARAGRPRPTLVDLPKDVTSAPWQAQVASTGSPASAPLDERSLRHAAQLLMGAQRPLILAGHGVLLARATHELDEVARLLGAPIATTLLGLTSIDEHADHALGMIGMHGQPAANLALRECDVLLVVGARLDDRATGRLDTFAPQAQLIHVDIDASELGKNRQPAVGVRADAREALARLLPMVATQPGARNGWAQRIAEMKQAARRGWRPREDGRILPQQAVATLGRLLPTDAIVVAGVGQHQMWTALHLGFRRTHTWLTSGGLGAMGYALPAAIGAQLAAPERPVVVVDGDGCFHMTSNELATAVRHKLPLKIFVLNNASMGMVRQWQDLFHGARHTAIDNSHLPSFARLAEAYGATGLTVGLASELPRAFTEALSHRDGPVVVDVLVEPTQHVYPMVPPGAANHEFIMESDN